MLGADAVRPVPQLCCKIVCHFLYFQQQLLLYTTPVQGLLLSVRLAPSS
jgi:hypothetical protein